MNANDPQVQIAEDDTAKIEEFGAGPQSIVGAPIDISKSLAPYVIIYDENGSAVASSGLLKGIIPAPPKGVFSYLKTNLEDRFTWEPEKNIRSAVVMRKINGPRPGFILVGRSLREIEAREMSLRLMILSAWASAMFVTFIYSAYIVRRSR